MLSHVEQLNAAVNPRTSHASGACGSSAVVPGASGAEGSPTAKEAMRKISRTLHALIPEACEVLVFGFACLLHLDGLLVAGEQRGYDRKYHKYDIWEFM